MKKFKEKKTSKTILLYTVKVISTAPGKCVARGTAEDKSNFNESKITPTIITQNKVIYSKNPSESDREPQGRVDLGKNSELP